MTWPEAEERLRPPNTDMPLEQFRRRIRDRLGPRATPAWEEAVLGNFALDPDGILRRNLAVENHMRILRHLYEHRPSTLFARVRCPILVVVALSPNDPPASEREQSVRAILAEAEPHCDLRVVWLRDTLHDVPLDRPDQLADLIADLAGKSP
jgi:pimeloyl-ACP methyl ester carboxylesterase